jgi:hypothetical protein
MKFNIVKTLISFGISVVFGLLCFMIAKDTDYRNWIGLAITTISVFSCLLTAIGLDFSIGNKIVNLRVVAWLFTILIIIANFIFCAIEYNIIMYIAIIMLLVLINLGITYSLYQRK